MSIQFPYLPPPSRDCFLTEVVPEQQPPPVTDAAPPPALPPPVRIKPERATISITVDGVTKEYYKPTLTVLNLIAIGKRLAPACAYPTFTVSLLGYNNSTAYASIIFQKRIDHATKTYAEICQTHNIPEEQRVDLASLSFVVPLEHLQSGDSVEGIERLDQARALAFRTFITSAYINGRPADLAFESIYRPTYEQRLALHRDHPNLREYIAATDCVVFAYKRVLGV